MDGPASLLEDFCKQDVSLLCMLVSARDIIELAADSEISKLLETL
jgi:hypothetical protein